MNEHNGELLKLTLQAAVPLWIERVQAYSDEHRISRAAICAQVIAEKGDVILYRSKRKNETANAFNHLAEGLACLSFVPGGVTAFGLHFEAKL